MDNNQNVLIFGAGIAGLTAAHELIERGFKVTIIEKEKEVGGKARSFMLPGKNHSDKLFPGAHGFRFFLHWYENLQDTLQRIPAERDRTVLDNLMPVDEYIFSFVKAEPVLVRPPLVWINMLAYANAHYIKNYSKQ
jgi:flavin-dependent dehydrogenase